ncbi:ABC transporter-like protein 12 [Elsinoe fawcettii]|nr:ABC transporter-like protein 12 [Elsinoe fawcettii]
MRDGLGTMTTSISQPHEQSGKRFLRVGASHQPTKADLAILIVALTSAIAAGVPFPLMAIIWGQLVNDLNSATCDADASSADGYQGAVNDKVLLIVYVGIAYFVLIYIYMFAWNLSSERLAQRLREKYLSSIFRQDATFFDKMNAGEVSSRITEDIATIQQGTNEKIGIVIGCLSFFIVAYVVAFIMDPKLAGMLVSLLPAFLIMAVGGGYFVQKYFQRSIESLTKASSVALQAFSNTTIVHAFSANARLEEKFLAALGPGLASGLWKSVATATQAGLLYFIAFSANGLAFWQGSRRIADALDSGNTEITVGNTYTVILVLVDASLVLATAAPFLRSFSAASAAFTKLEADIDHKSAIDGTDKTSGDTLASVVGDVEMYDVDFAFPSSPDKPVLRDISLKFPAGQQTALVGLSGSGKSTITQLITRMYDPTKGHITMDGHDLKDLNVRSIRGQISLVQQEPCLLSRSILENIALGLVNSPKHQHLQEILLGDVLVKIALAVRNGDNLKQATQSHNDQVQEIVGLVENAAALADAAEFVQGLDQGYGTLVGSKGGLISGGQKQRISLARAIVKDPRILILDEATASLDSASEIRIQKALEKVAIGRTVITVAHRLSTIKSSNNIIVMRQGKVVEQGTHENLIEANGAYAELVRLQNLNVKGGDENAGSIDISSLSTESVTALDEKTAAQETAVPVLSEKGKKRKGHSGKTSSGDEADTPSTTRSLGSLFRPHTFSLIIATAAAAIIGGTYCLSAIIFGNVVGKLSPCESTAAIRHAGHLWGLLFFMLGILEFLANFIGWSLFGWIAEQIVHKVRVLSLRAILEQDLAWHESKDRNPSLLLALITKDSGALNGLAGSVICTILSIFVSMIATITLTHIIAWKIAVVCLAVVPLLLGAGYMRVTTLAKFEETHLESFANSNAITVEAVNSIRAVMALGLEHEILQTYRRSLVGPVQQAVKHSAWANLWLAIGYGQSNFVYALAYWWGSVRIIAGDYSQTQFFIVLMALLVSSQLWGQAFALAPDVSRAVQATRRLMALLNQGSTKHLSAPLRPPHDPESSPSTSEKAPTPNENESGIPVSFHNVSFSYPARPDTQILTDLSLSIPPNTFAALVGPSGAGKSTIISLLERLYPVNSGSILVNGHDISRSPFSFRDDIAYVPQSSVLFDDTVRFNLLLGARPGVTPTQAELEAACKAANIHDVIMALDRGYDAPVGANGDRLSGGQKQRLAVARALVRKPRLLLLDESTSALDAESERLLQEGLERVARRMTVVAIAHRLYTIRKAGVIFLVEGGRVVDQGRHEELVVRSERYRLNVEAQAVV